MSNYSGATKVKEARESLGKALEALQSDTNIPPDVLAVAQNIAQSVGALFEAQNASSEPDGRACVKNALGTLSQTLALLQDVREEHPGVKMATETIAKSMGILFPLTQQSASRPPPASAPAPTYQDAARTIPDDAPSKGPGAESGVARAPYREGQPREHIEANIGATTESNIYVGFSGEVKDGGVFVATYNILPPGSPVRCLITLPGNLSCEVNGTVRFVRDPMDMASDSEPGMGIAFENLDADARELILRFIRKRAPMFYDE